MRYFNRLLEFLPERASNIKQDVLREHAYHMAQIRHSPLARNLIDEIFESYVLPLHVNDEEVKPFAGVFYAELKEKVYNLKPYDAAIAVNYWCMAHVNYAYNNAPTAAAIDVYKRGYGRCGEESTFAVCALRSVGIPARQCYAPKWSHCDDNHAWVEVYVDGSWHYMGACEAEPQLNRGWFTHAASRAMLVHMVAATRYKHEDSIGLRGKDMLINRISSYAKSKPFTVLITDNGKPIVNAYIRLEIFNYGAFMPIASGLTDENGQFQIMLGYGSVGIFAQHKNKHCFKMINTIEQNLLTIDLVAQCKPMLKSFVQIAPIGILADDEYHYSQNELARFNDAKLRYDKKMLHLPYEKWVASCLGLPKGNSCIVLQANVPLVYNENFGIEYFNGAAFEKLSLSTQAANSLYLQAGQYRINSYKRQLNGDIHINSEYIELIDGEERMLRLDVPAPIYENMLKNVKLETGFACGILAYIEGNSEPMQHFLNEAETHARAINALEMTVQIHQVDNRASAALHELQNKFDVGDRRLPFVIAVYNGTGVYAFANYQVGIIHQIIDLISYLRNNTIIHD